MGALVLRRQLLVRLLLGPEVAVVECSHLGRLALVEQEVAVLGVGLEVTEPQAMPTQAVVEVEVEVEVVQPLQVAQAVQA
jgi:hypothetical protein